ncbi:flagellar hook-associated protein FlgK [Glaciibacter sp. 2TAF33]|uniref:flagellar hook-associated protein FlgK n=1 Tax=Glaciibacter sp. 2TAF33 TaxID=3233015 RepID=UPI003F925037
MSTFGGLNTAYTGLQAARAGLDVVGQNIANANTAGYTRQRVTTSAINAPVGLFGGGARVGMGVSVDGIARLGNANLDAQVRFTAGSSGYTAVRANALSGIETSLHEPGKDGLSTQLQEFWAAWGDLSNSAGEQAQSGLLIGQAKNVAAQIAQGYQAVDNQWTEVRGNVTSMVGELNQTAAQVADLNGRIRLTLAAGGNANELLDQRNALTTTIAALTGGSVRQLADGTVDVLVGGNALVSGTTVQQLGVAGASRMDGVMPTTPPSSPDPVRLVWANRPGTPVSVEGGEIAGALSVLAAPDGAGTGGAIAEAAVSYNAFATDLVTKVNAIHQGGATPGGMPGGIPAGTTGLNFFNVDPDRPALTMTVVPTDASGIATGTPGTGPRDGSTADRIAQLGTTPDSPNKAWGSFVTNIGIATKTELQQANLAGLAATSATTSQLSNSAVDLDEENVNLLMFQHAYQGAARVMTAVDEMLDTLINRTGLVGR